MSISPRTAAVLLSAAALFGPAAVAHGRLMEDLPARTAVSSEEEDCPISEQAQEAFICDWRVVKRSALDSTRRHAWNFCVSVAKSNRKRKLTCTISDSKSTETTAEISGEFPVGIAALSASVGYNVTETKTAEGSTEVTVKRKQAGALYWAPVYGNRFRVTQRLYLCNRPAPEGPPGGGSCHKKAGKRFRAYAYTEQYEGPTFDFFAKGREPKT